MRRKPLPTTFLVLAAALAVSACGGSDAPETSANETSALENAGSYDDLSTATSAGGNVASDNLAAPTDVGAGMGSSDMSQGGTGLDSVTGVGTGAGAGGTTTQGGGAAGTSGGSGG